VVSQHILKVIKNISTTENFDAKKKEKAEALLAIFVDLTSATIDTYETDPSERIDELLKEMPDAILSTPFTFYYQHRFNEMPQANTLEEIWDRVI